MTDVVVTYRRTSRLSMRIGRQGEVRVSAPFGLPESEVRRFVESHRDWIARAREQALQRRDVRTDFFARLPLSSPKEREAATQRLDRLIQPLVERYAARMGVAPSGITYKPTVSRCGCCHTRTRIVQFSLYLLLLPEWCIEHIVVHELAHLLVANHGPQFRAVMDRFFPLWKEARRETRRISREGGNHVGEMS